MTLLPALISIGLLAACGGGLASTRSGTAPDIMDTQSDAVQAPRRLTPSHDGGVFEMNVGRSVALVVSAKATGPESEGQDSVAERLQASPEAMPGPRSVGPSR